MNDPFYDSAYNERANLYFTGPSLHQSTDKCHHRQPPLHDTFFQSTKNDTFQISGKLGRHHSPRSLAPAAIAAVTSTTSPPTDASLPPPRHHHHLHHLHHHSTAFNTAAPSSLSPRRRDFFLPTLSSHSFPLSHCEFKSSAINKLSSHSPGARERRQDASDESEAREEQDQEEQEDDEGQEEGENEKEEGTILPSSLPLPHHSQGASCTVKPLSTCSSSRYHLYNPLDSVESMQLETFPASQGSFIQERPRFPVSAALPDTRSFVTSHLHPDHCYLTDWPVTPSPYTCSQGLFNFSAPPIDDGYLIHSPPVTVSHEVTPYARADQITRVASDTHNEQVQYFTPRSALSTNEVRGNHQYIQYGERGGGGGRRPAAITSCATDTSNLSPQVTFQTDQSNRHSVYMGDEARGHFQPPPIDSDYLHFLSRERKYHHRYPQYESNLSGDQPPSSLIERRVMDAKYGEHKYSWWGDGSAWQAAGNCDTSRHTRGEMDGHTGGHGRDGSAFLLPGTIDSLYPQTHLPSFTLDPLGYQGREGHIPVASPLYLGTAIEDDEENQPSKRQQLDKLFDGDQVHSCVDGCFFLLRFSLFILLLTKLILITTLLVQGRFITYIDYTRLDESDVTLIITGYLALTIIFALIIPVPESKFYTHYITIILLNCFTIGELLLNATSVTASTNSTAGKLLFSGNILLSNPANITSHVHSSARSLSSPLNFSSSASSVSFVFAPLPPSITASAASSSSSETLSSQLSSSPVSPAFFASSSSKPLSSPSSHMNHMQAAHNRTFTSVTATISPGTDLTKVSTITPVIDNVKSVTNNSHLLDQSQGPLIITADLNLPSFSVSVFAFVYLICLTFKFLFTLLNYFVAMCKPPPASHILVLKVPPSNL